MTTLAYVNNPDGSPASPQAPQATPPVTATPTPVAPVQTAPTPTVSTPTPAVSTPTATPTATTPTVNPNQAQHDANVANRMANPLTAQAPTQSPTPQHTADQQAIGPQNGMERMPQMNTNGTPVVPISATTPIPTAKTEKVASTTAVAPSPAVQTTEQRSSEIMSHLQQGLSTNPGLFSDINTYRNAYGYYQKSPEERSLLDNFFNSNKPSTDSYLSGMISGTATQGNNTPEFKQATAQFRNISPYIHATDPTQLISAVSTGKLGASDLTTIQKYNPALYQAYQKKQAVYNQANAVNTNIVGTAPNVPDMNTVLQNISNSATGTVSSPEYDAYKRYQQQDPHIQSSYANVDDSYAKLKEYNDAKAKAKADVENTYGTTLTDGAKAALLSKRVSQLDTIYGDPVSNVNNANSQLSSAISNGGFKYYENDYQNTVGKQLTAVSDYNTSQYLTKLAQNDPVTAVNALVKKYEDMGVYASRTPQEIQKAVADEMAKGMTLPQALTELNTAFQGKSSFKSAEALKTGGITTLAAAQLAQQKAQMAQTGSQFQQTLANTQNQFAWTKNYQQQQLDMGKYIQNPMTGELYNQKTGESKADEDLRTAYAQQYGGATPTVQSVAQVCRKGDNLQCGMVSNDYMKANFVNAPRVGDSYESKVSAIDAIGRVSMPVVGGIFALDTGTKEGHTGVVTGVGPNGITVAEANRSGNGSGTPVTSGTYQNLGNMTFSAGPTTKGANVPTFEEYKAQNQTNQGDKGEQMMSALINAGGDPNKLPAKGQYNRSIVSAYLANRGIDVQQLKPAMSSLNAMAGGVGNTAFDHLNMLKQAITQTSDGVLGTVTDTNILNSIKKWAGNVDVTDANMLASLASEELGKAYGAGTGGEKEKMLETLANGTKQQKLSIIQQSKQALSDKYLNANSAYKQVTGKDHPEFIKLQSHVDNGNIANQTNTAPTSVDTTAVSFKSSNGKSYSF